MAVKTALGIDIGQDSIKLVELTKVKGDIHLSRVKVLKTEIAPSTTKAERDNIIAERLSEILGDVNVRKSALTIATPGLSSFIRYVKLPPVSPNRLQQIIGYEAQQQVPFPLEEVIWDYQVLKSGGKSETNVILVAIKSQVVDDLIGAMDLQGLEPSFIEHRPLALYNCVRFNQETEGKVTVMIDVGATATDLSIEREGEPCWTRSARIGGKDITEAIQNALHISFNEAEDLKKVKGTIYLTEDDEKSASAEDKRLWEAIRPVVQEMVTELQRSVSYFRSQLEGGKMDRILLTGGCTRLRNFASFIEDQLGIEVRKLNPLKNIAYSPEVFEGEDLESELGVAVGLALRGMGQGFSTVNLLPKIVVSRKELRKKRVYLMLSGLCMPLILGVSATFSRQNCSVMRHEVKKISTELAAYNSHDREIQELKGEHNKIQGKINILESLVLARDYWPDILLELGRILPDNVILRSISALEQEKHLIQLKGRTPNFDAVTNLISCLEQSPVFGTVNVISATSEEEIVRETREAETSARETVRMSRTTRRGPMPPRRGRRETPRAEEERKVTTETRKAGINFVLHAELISPTPLKEIVIKVPEERAPERDIMRMGPPGGARPPLRPRR